MKKVAVLGWYGHGNFGDALVLEGFKTLFHDWQVIVMSDNTKSTYPMINFNVVNQCDLFVLGGGELVNPDRLFIESPWAHKIKIPKVILGCGVNAEKPRQLKRRVIHDLEQFDFIGLRDYTALNILRQKHELKGKVGLFYDCAFAVNTQKRKQKPENTAAVIPTDRFTAKSDRGIRKFNLGITSRTWLKQRLQGYAKTVFLPFGMVDNNDLVTCKQLAPYAPNSEILNPQELTLQKVLNIIGKCKKVFPYRLHGLILSFLLGVPYEFYPYHWKLERVHDTVSGYSANEVRIIQQTVLEEVKKQVE